jgi:hypothetical protein
VALGRLRHPHPVIHSLNPSERETVPMYEGIHGLPKPEPPKSLPIPGPGGVVPALPCRPRTSTGSTKSMIIALPALKTHAGAGSEPAPFGETTDSSFHPWIPLSFHPIPLEKIGPVYLVQVGLVDATPRVPADSSLEYCFPNPGLTLISS